MIQFYVFKFLGNGDYKRLELQDEAELWQVKQALLANNQEFIVVKYKHCDEYRPTLEYKTQLERWVDRNDATAKAEREEYTHLDLELVNE
jgi:hypothetical protein